MRTKTWFLTAALVAAGALTSMAQSNVYSLNVVGYVNVNLPSGFSLVNNPLNVAAGNSLENTLGTNVLDGTTVYHFASGHYDVVASFIAQGANIWDTSLNINPGDGIFVFSPGAQTVTFVGEVLQGSQTNSIPNGFSILGSKVPQAGGLVSVLGFPAKDQDVVYQFHAGYSTDTFFGPPTVPAGSEFWDGGSEPSLTVAEGFFLFTSAGAHSWIRSFTVQ